METLQERARKRRKNITIATVSLHSKEHHSFHPHLSDKEAWELLAKLSQERWMEESKTTHFAPLDKTKVKVIRH